MAIEILMPALSPTMEEGTLAKWLVKEGDTVKSGQIIAEIETDKATMEFEAVDEGTVGKLLVAEGTAGVKVNTPIATLIAEGESADAAPAAAPAAAPERPTARLETAQQAARRQAARAPRPRPSASDASPAIERPAETPNEAPAEPPEGAASQAVAAASAAEPAAEPADAAPPAVPTPAHAGASAAPPAYLAGWPADTRLTYQLGGNYRGELHGNAQVLWQREGTRYQAAVQIDLGLLLSLRFTSQGEITERGLKPEVYEEQVRQRRRGVRMGDDVRLNNGERVPRPEDVQDTASQFVEMGHRFATDPAALKAGSEIRLWLARPGGVDQWTYDVVGEDTLQLPRLGAVPAFHLKPRPLDKPRGPIQAEIWIAPSVQYLPVRIRLTQGPDTYMDLMVETIEQR